MPNFDRVYDKSVKVKDINSNNMLGIAIGHLCFGPIRLVRRVFSNICILPVKDQIRVLKRAVLFSGLLVAFSIPWSLMNHRIHFLVGTIISIILLFIPIVILKKKAMEYTEESGPVFEIDKKGIEEMCNQVPQMLDTIIEEANNG